MSSSTFASEPPSDAQWGRWLATFLIAAVSATAALFAAIVLLDPYSTGRLTPIKRVDIMTDSPWVADAARARNPDFDGAIVGNSHIQAIEPSRLNELLGASFVSLALPGTLPYEQAVIVRSFALHHQNRASFLVWGIDDWWCEAPQAYRPSPVPLWLYQSSDAEYLSHLLSPDALNLSVHHALMLLGLREQDGSADGFDQKYLDDIFHRFQPRFAERLATMRQPTQGQPVDAPMQELDLLAAVLPAINAATRIVILRPPIFAKNLPSPGSPAAHREAACRNSLASIVATRPGTTLLDLRVDFPLARDQTNFYDESHFNGEVARFVEQNIADAIGTLNR